MSRFFKSFFTAFPTVHADDGEEAELVNPQQVLRVSSEIANSSYEKHRNINVFPQEECALKPQLASLFGRYQKCTDRVQSKTQTTENCSEEFFDYLHELDHCVAHSLFDHLK